MVERNTASWKIKPVENYMMNIFSKNGMTLETNIETTGYR